MQVFVEESGCCSPGAWFDDLPEPITGILARGAASRTADGQRFTKVGRDGIIICSRKSSTRAYHRTTCTRLSDHTSEYYHQPKTAIDFRLALHTEADMLGRPGVGPWGRSAGDWRGVQPNSPGPGLIPYLGPKTACRRRQALPDRVSSDGVTRMGTTVHMVSLLDSSPW